MLSKMRRCLECDYTWSHYLDFPTCPKCGENVVEAKVRREVSRTKKIAIIVMGIGVAISVLAEIFQLVFA
jgi:predicted RNA-binding Zn-ribbon protein involved in translation (DUF1610 family)